MLQKRESRLYTTNLCAAIPVATLTKVKASIALIIGSMHYEKAPRFRRSKLGWGPPPLRCAVQGLRSATAALWSNCCGVRGGKNRRRTLASRRENGILTLRGKDKR